MFTKEKIKDVRAFLNSFDRIFIDETLLKNDSASERLAEILKENLLKKHCIVLNEKTLRSGISKALIKKLQDQDLLLVKDGVHIITLNTSYCNAAAELSKRKHYKMLLISNDAQESLAFLKLDYDDNHVNDLGACGIDPAGLFSYVYQPPEERILFTVTANAETESLQLLFYKTLAGGAVKILYPADDPKTQAEMKGKGVFEYSSTKRELFESDLVQFVAKYRGSQIASPKCDFYLEKEQHWSVQPAGSSLAAKIIQEGDLPSPVPPSAPEGPARETPKGEKYPYYGGQPTKLTTDSIIEVEEPVEGAVLKTREGNSIRLVKKLGAGGEGVVYATDRPNIVCKILNNRAGTNLTRNKKEKIEFMTRHPISHPLVIWPLNAVYTQGNVFVGFTMKAVKGIELKALMDQMKYRDGSLSCEFGIFNLDRTQIVRMIISILETLCFLHERNIIIGDIKMENFMIMNRDPSKVYFVDCDSYQVGRFQATKVSAGFVPPELANKKVDLVYRTFSNEYYALFALLFMILHKAVKPYSQKGEAMEMTEEQRAGAGIFPYFLNAEKTVLHAPNGYPSPNWSHLPGYIKKAFCSMGQRNGDHFAAEKRYTAQEWLKLFRAYDKDLQNGRLAAKDRRCNTGVFGAAEEPIDYAAVDLKISSIVTKLMSDVSLNELIRKSFLSARRKEAADRIGLIEKTLRKTVEYKDSNYRFILKKNLGCYYSVEFSYKE